MRFAVVSVAIALVAPFASVGAQQIVYREPLVPIAVGSAIPAGDGQESAAAKPDVRALDNLAFDAFGRRFELALEPNRMLAAAAARARIGADVGIYRGRIDGIDGSWVRLVLGGGETRGLFSDGSEIYAVDMLPDDATGALAPYVYRLDDLIVAPGMLACSAGDDFETGSAVIQALVEETAPQISSKAGATAVIDLGVVADFAFASAMGSRTEAELLARMNNVDGIFSSELGVEISVSRVDAFSSENDPFTDDTNPVRLLGEVADYRQTTVEQSATGLTHLFTGRDLDGTTVGIAYTDTLCHSHYGVGLTEGTHGTVVDSLITAHEIGHNFGAPHDGTSGSVCESEPQTYLMAPSINGSDQFSACSIREMQARVAVAGCVRPLAGVDVAVAGIAMPAILLGDEATLEFEVDNVGAVPVSDAVVDVSLPAGAGYVGATTPGGSCTAGAGTVSCSLPAISAGAGTTIDVDVEPAQPGDLDFVAVARSSDDANPANDADTLRLTTNPAVDVAAVAAGSTTVTVNTKVAVTPSIENHSGIAATAVTVTVTPSAGIDLVSAEWSAGSCAIGANIATCTTPSIAPETTTTLSLMLAGTVAGGQSYVVQVSAAEFDRLTANNSASGTIEVSAAPAASSAGGGSGAFGWPSLLLLLLAGLAGHVRDARRKGVADRSPGAPVNPGISRRPGPR